MPTTQWTWRQSWRDLLFAHWPVKVEDIRPLVPAALVIQEFDGTSWIGLVPFQMAGVMRRPLPDLPWISAFPELNVRLYVELDGKPGVWFLSLDATNPLAVWAARRFFHLPYFKARITVESSGDAIRYTANRSGGEPSMVAEYRPTSQPYTSVPGTLDHWLTERYCLYAQSPDGTIWRNEVHHAPWPLQTAEVEFSRNTYLSFHGLRVPGNPVTLHFARRLDVVVWNATRCQT
jgi:uncharacterized protein YqjF (DUF2071 family)